MNSHIILAKCSVEYDGRGLSKLSSGVYLIIIKADASLQVHTSRLIKPINYMAAGSRIEFDGSNIIARNHSETIKIIVSETIYAISPAEWHDNKIHMLRTEAELVKKLAIELKTDFPNDEYILEYDTKSLGLIDLVRVDTSFVYHSYEVKRKKASIANVSQSIRYVDYLSAINKKCVGYIVAPSITDNAMDYAKSKNIIVKIIDF